MLLSWYNIFGDPQQGMEAARTYLLTILHIYIVILLAPLLGYVVAWLIRLGRNWIPEISRMAGSMTFGEKPRPSSRSMRLFRYFM